MCGILAVIGEPLPDERSFARALELLRHRGPDDAGLVRTGPALLGNRRLSIIDLSAAGHQPFFDEETGVALTYNGEIFNYVELRAELEQLGHTFRSSTDTEVLLRSYLQWGEDCLPRLNGMWAFALWDPREHRAFLARDRFGEKPFYYATGNGSLSVASEPKALLALHPGLRRADDVAVYDLLSGERTAGERSFYTGIRRLLPGCAMRYEPVGTGLHIGRYWSLPGRDPEQPPEEDAVERFRQLFDDSVRIRMRSDVPVGLTLSGGLDSTSVLHAASRAEPGNPLTAFTSVYPRSDAGVVDERDWAARAAAPYPAVRLERVPAAADDWLAVLRRIVWHLDGPGYSPAVFPLWKIVERARERGVPVLLEGQGGDELLAGYGHHLAFALVDSVEAALRRTAAGSLEDAIGTFRAGVRSVGRRRFGAEVAAAAFPRLKEPYRRLAGSRSVLRPEFVAEAGAAAGDRRAAERNGAGRLERALAEDFSRRTLPSFLHYGDAIAMAHSVENRLPFLDHRLVDHCFRLAAGLKLGGGETKHVLRRYLRLGGHDAIAGRVDKKGYPTPTGAWLSAQGGALAREILLDRDAPIQRYADRRRLERLIVLHRRGLVASEQLYTLVETEVWLETCIATDARPAS